MKRFLLAIAAFFLMTSSGFAQSSGMYLGLFGGGAFAFDQEIEDDITEFVVA